MELQHCLAAVAAIVVLCASQSAAKKPDDPYWSLFAQRLSNTTGREVAIINVLGLNDPTIKKVWTEYRRHMPKLVETSTAKPTTTQPPLPSLYQTSYQFSSSQAQRQSEKLKAQLRAKQNNAMVGQIMALVKQIKTTTPKPVSFNNVVPNTLQSSLRSHSSADLLMMYAKLKELNSRSMTSPRDNMMAKLAGLHGMSGVANLAQPMSGMAQSMSGVSLANQPNMNIPRYQVATTTTTTTSTTPTPPAAVVPKSASLGQLIEMYQQMYKAASTTQSPNKPTSKQDAFDKQLKQFFPQFNNIALPTAAAVLASAGAPVSAGGNVTANVSVAAASNATKSKTEQMIFDALLFGPNPSPINVTKIATTTMSPQPVPSAVNTGSGNTGSVNMGGPGGSTNMGPNLPSAFDIFGGAAAAKKSGPGNYMENVIRTRASRELGCRFMTELIGVEMQHDLPMGMDCTGKCLFPRVKSIKNGPFCVCCPIYVSDSSITFMSVLKRFKYMTDAPFRVLS